MEELEEDDLEELKQKLKKYSRDEIEFNEPHFTNQLVLREGNKEDVVNNLLNPDGLVHSYQERGKYAGIIHCLHFKISNTRTLKLPVIFDRNGKKGLYILTYIMRHRAWQQMVRTKRG